VTAQEHLDLIDAVIAKRLRGDSYESYSEAEESFSGTPLLDLYTIRDKLRAEVTAGSGGNFSLLEPFSS